DYYERNEIPGIVRLQRIYEHFTHAVWLNPEEPRYWIHPTVRAVGKIFPMFPLTLDGLGEAAKKLIVKR
ncbi:VWA containing CoxE family protein, partial [Chloroflexota bacterium]